MNENNSISNKLIINKKDKLNYIDIIIFLFSFFALSTALIAFFPGIVTSDTVVQWSQMDNNVYNSWHPIFHTLLQKLFRTIWNSPAIICIVQITCLALLLTAFCKITRDNEKKFGVICIQILVCCIICFFPINLMYSVSLWKDILYSFSLLCLMFYIYKGIKKDFKYTKFEYIFIDITLVFISLLRYNGIVVSLIILSFILIYSIVKKQFIHYLKILGLFVIIFILFKTPELLVKKNYDNMRYKQGVYIHITSALLKNNRINNEEDLNFLDNILDVDFWRNRYNPYTHDSLMFSTDQQIDDKFLQKNSTQFKSMVIKYSVKNLDVVIHHYIKLTSSLWNPIPSNDPEYYSYLCSTKSNEGNIYTKDEKPLSNTLNHIIEKSVNFIYNSKLLNKTIYRPSIYLYISLIIILIICKIKKNKKYILLITPMILNFVSLLPALPSQDFRYSYINLLTFCVLQIILLTSFAKTLYKQKKEKRMNLRGDKFEI